MANWQAYMLGTVGFTLSLVLTSVASAWQSDLHHSLTQWLAIQAGFSRQDAVRIAQGAYSYDTSGYTDAIGNVVYVCFSGSLPGARELQRRHFPTDAIFPSPPLSRPVTPNSASARAEADAAIGRGAAANVLDILGQSLHPLQDSWAHQGVPDVPWGCIHSDLVSAHPKEKGGWTGHTADLTHLWVEQAVETARETYAILTAFLARNAGSRADAPRDWTDIEPVVREFAKASTDRAKRQWATKYLAEPIAVITRQLSGITLPGAAPVDVARVFAVRPPAGERSKFEQLSAADTPGLLRDAERFFNRWLVQRNIQAAVESIDITSLTAQFPNSFQATGRDWVLSWLRKFLVMPLVADHSQVESAGHGDPTHPLYNQLPEFPPRDGPFRVARDVSAPSLTIEDFFPVQYPRPARGVILSFSNLPGDTIGLVWAQFGNSWSIVRMMSVAGSHSTEPAR